MIVATHLTLATTIFMITGLKDQSLIGMLLLGSVLPDIDQPQSIIGKILFFLSYPINRMFGHRTLTHSFLLWIIILIIGTTLKINTMWLCLGAFTHILLDCLNMSGVSALYPLSEKIFVLTSKKHRITVGSRGEFIVMILLVFVAWGGWQISTQGGIRAVVQKLLGDYIMAKESYEREGLKICYLEGVLRYPNGQIITGEWLIIGTDRDQNALTIYCEKNNKLIHIPHDAKFLRANLKKTKERVWQTVSVKEPVKLLEGEVYYKILKRWNKAKAGETVAGYMIYEKPVTLSTGS